MAQSDQTVQNATFPAVRADINDNLAALYSQSSGNSAPTTTVAFQPWVDTSSSPPVYKIRNATNSGWITIGVLDTNFEVGGITPIANGGTGETTASAAINALVPSQTGNAGKFLGTDGTALSWLVAASGVSVQAFTSSGTYTPTASKTSYLVFVVAGGGGGGGGGRNISSQATYQGGGGGSGGCSWRIYNNTEMGADAVVTVGGGGAGSSWSNTTFKNTAGSGGSSSFNPAGTGVTLTSSGGAGGQSGGSNGDSAGAAAGTSTAGSITTWTGNTGGGGTTSNTTTGQNHTFSGGGLGGYATFFGGGRGGNSARGQNSGASGTGGIVVILEF
jgi:hypothetical protein